METNNLSSSNKRFYMDSEDLTNLGLVVEFSDEEV